MFCRIMPLNNDLFRYKGLIDMLGEVGIDRFQAVRGYPCWERSLTDRLEYGKPSQYETGLITVDYPGF